MASRASAGRSSAGTLCRTASRWWGGACLQLRALPGCTEFCPAPLCPAPLCDLKAALAPSRPWLCSAFLILTCGPSLLCMLRCAALRQVLAQLWSQHTNGASARQKGPKHKEAMAAAGECQRQGQASLRSPGLLHLPAPQQSFEALHLPP